MISGLTVGLRRERLLHRLFPADVPVLWCPALTHYTDSGRIDEERIAAHLRHLAPHVKGFLVPGSTGDGWELTATETRHLLEIASRHAETLKLDLIVGALQHDTSDALRFIRDTAKWVDFTGQSRARGFAVCPPRGGELTQAEIGNALAAILETGLPVALYQLPQVTQNEISPELACVLSARFENFILFKDSSGSDRVVLQGKSLDGVFRLRGAEGDYARMLTAGGGSYDGFLLSTANCFAPQFCEMIYDLANGRQGRAAKISNQLSAVATEVFQLVAALPQGNAFTNANKAIDHFFAWGARACSVPSPRLHAGGRLPVEIIQKTGAVLVRHGLLPKAGYL